MQFIKHIFIKHRSTALAFLLMIIFAVIIKVSAISGGPFTTGETLNPTCLPTDVNCVVNIFPTDATGSLKNDGAGNLTWGAAGSTIAGLTQNYLAKSNAAGDNIANSIVFDDGTTVFINNNVATYGERLNVNGNVYLGVNPSNTVYSTKLQLVGSSSSLAFDNNWGVDKIIFRNDVIQKITTDASGNFDWLLAGKNFTFSDVGNVGIGGAIAVNQLKVRINQGTDFIDLGQYAGGAGYSGMYFNQATPSFNNYAILGTTNNLLLNAPSASGVVELRNFGAVMATVNNVGLGVGVVPTAKLHVQGSTSDSSAFALKIDNSTPIEIISARNDGLVLVNGLTVGKGGGFVATNTAFGYSALSNNLTGIQNTAIGYQAGESSTGNYNTLVGVTAGRANSGNGNSVFGNAAAINMSGDYNSFFGYIANGGGILSGQRNSGFGHQSLMSNSSGNFNAAYGNGSGYSNTTGSSNVFVGFASGYSSSTVSGIVAVGYYSLFANTTGTANTAVGFQSLTANTTGYDNTSVGYSSLTSNTTGYQNISIGTSSMAANISGAQNVAIGLSALQLGTTATSNVAVGYSALLNNTANGSTAIGHRALLNNTSGSDNTVVGATAMFNNTTGWGHTAIGTNAGFTNDGQVKNVFIGYGAGFYETGSNKLFIDNDSRFLTDPATSETNARTKALIYGEFNADPTLQNLTFNANVGIGTSTPAANQKLHVSGGNVQIGDSGAAKGITLYDISSPTSAYCVRIDGGGVAATAGACP